MTYYDSLHALRCDRRGAEVNQLTDKKTPHRVVTMLIEAEIFGISLLSDPILSRLLPSNYWIFGITLCSSLLPSELNLGYQSFCIQSIYFGVLGFYV